jgi:hypothetical protein
VVHGHGQQPDHEDRRAQPGQHHPAIGHAVEHRAEDALVPRRVVDLEVEVVGTRHPCPLPQLPLSACRSPSATSLSTTQSGSKMKER